MKEIIFLALATLLLALAACSDSVAPPEPEIRPLFGSWRWVKGVGGFMGETITPLETGNNEKAIFQSNRVARFFVNDSMYRQTTFHVREEWPGYCFVWFEDTPGAPQRLSFQGPDTLTIGSTCSACYEQTYVRMGDERVRY